MVEYRYRFGLLYHHVFYINYHEAEVHVLKRNLSHNSDLDWCSVRLWFKGEPIYWATRFSTIV